MIKIIPHASNNITIEIENGDKFEIITDRNHLDISVVKGDIDVSIYDFIKMEWTEGTRCHTIRITNP